MADAGSKEGVAEGEALVIVPAATPSQPPLPVGPAVTFKTTPGGVVRISNLRRGMVFWGDLKPSEARGQEQVHATDTLYVVVSSDRIHQTSSIVQVVPLTSQMHVDGDPASPFRKHRIRILRNDLTRYAAVNPLRDIDQIALTEQVRVFAQLRLSGQPVGQVARVTMSAIDAGLKYVFNLL